MTEAVLGGEGMPLNKYRLVSDPRGRTFLCEMVHGATVSAVHDHERGFNVDGRFGTRTSVKRSDLRGGSRTCDA